MQTEPAASHTVQRRRTTEVVLRFLAGAPPGVWVSDRWQPPLHAPAVQDQICRAQQLRHLTDAAQAETGAARAAARAGAGAMAARLRAAIHPRHQHAAGALAVTAAAGAVAQSETDCDALLAQPLRDGGSDALQRREHGHRRGRLTFLHQPAVPPTTKASERRLRPSVVHGTVTGGFRAEAFARGAAALRTVTDTARKRGPARFPRLLAAAGPGLPLTTVTTLAHP